MSNYQSNVIRDQAEMIGDMCTIIGRFKGSMTVYADEIASTAKAEGVDEALRAKLEWMAQSMHRIIKENEQLWENRGLRKSSNNVELEKGA